MDPNCGVAILLDGEFVKKHLQGKLRRFPSAKDMTGLCYSLMQHQEFVGSRLHRIYYYTADPLTAGKLVNPLDKSTKNFKNTQVAQANAALLDALELEPNVAVRRGVLALHGWKLGKTALASLRSGKKSQITGPDLVPNIQQKGVDMRIGLDIAALALKKLVYGIVLVSGDSDMLPAMKFARREGLRVYLHTLGYASVRRDLKAHADILI